MIMNIPFFQNHTTHTHTKTGTIKEQMMNPAWINSNQDRKLFYREVMRRGRKWTISDMPLREISYDDTPLPTPAVQMDGRSKTFLSCCLLFSERRMSNRTPWCLTTTPPQKKNPTQKTPPLNYMKFSQHISAVIYFSCLHACSTEHTQQSLSPHFVSRIWRHAFS